MAKNVFRNGEVSYSNSKVFIKPPESRFPSAHSQGAVAAVPVQPSGAPEDVEPLEVEEYRGPTVDQLRREAEEFKKTWEAERERMIQEAKDEAARIVQEAEDRAFSEVKRKNDQAAKAKQDAIDEAEQTRAEARDQAQNIVAEAEKKARQVEHEAYEKGLDRGREEGYETGADEVKRIIDRLHVILNKAIDRRNEIIEESESQLVELVLQIAKKVIKVISENQKNVVVNNVVQALRRLKQKSDVTIRVNIQDLQVISDHAREVTRMIEKVGNITVAEDTTVDPGGAIIETDFGQIDARIASQLREIEDRILELMPIRTKRKQSSGGGGT